MKPRAFCWKTLSTGVPLGWVAVDLDREPGGPTGWGYTEKEAIADLEAQIMEKDDEQI